MPLRSEEPPERPRAPTDLSGHSFSNTLRFVILFPPTSCSIARLPSCRLDARLVPLKLLHA